MMNGVPNDVMDKIVKARVSMMNRFPFFSVLAMYLQVRPANIPTMGVTADGILHVNPEFVRKLNHQGLVFAMAHECMHLVTNTHGRCPVGGIHQYWNIASDCVINHIIHDHCGVQLPDPEIMKPIYGKTPWMGGTKDWSQYNGWSTEGVYYDIIKDLPPCTCGGKGDKNEKGQDGQDQEGSGGNQDSQGEDGENESGSGSNGGQPNDSGEQDSQSGGSGGGKGVDSNCPWHGDPTNGAWYDDDCATGEGMTEKQATEWKHRVAAAAAAQKGVGDMPGGLQDFINKILNPKKDWRKELSIYASNALKGKPTWRRPGRRTIGINIITPGRNPNPPQAVFYCDTSGSMSDENLIRAFSEAAEIIRIMGAKMRMILGDCEIYYDGEIDLSQITRLKVQRGGTDFRVLFDRIAETDSKPDVLVGFSDLEGPFPNVPPDFPVIWCQPPDGNGKAPWGKVITIED